MASGKPHVVVVMGSFQLPWQYRYLKAALEKHGYNTTIMNLPSTILAGSTVIEDSCAKDVEMVRKTVMAEIDDGHDVVVLAHSQGGVAATAALKGLGKTESKPGVTHIIFLAAWLVPLGKTAREQSGGNGPAWLDVRDGIQIVNTDPQPLLYNDVPFPLAEDAAKFIFPNCDNVNDYRVTYTAWKDIPATYVMCEKDAALYPPVQEWVIAACEFPGEVLRLEAGHSAFLSMPETVAGIVRWKAGEEGVDLTGVKVGGMERNVDAKSGWKEVEGVGE